MQLSPLRFSYEAAQLKLPVRLGLLNADGQQDLIVYVLHATSRFKAANYPNLFIPTNLEVSEEVRASFPEFYAELFDVTLSKHQGKGVVTEYSWDTGSCDPCPEPPLEPSELASLGADALPAVADVVASGEVPPDFASNMTLTRLHVEFGQLVVGWPLRADLPGLVDGLRVDRVADRSRV